MVTGQKPFQGNLTVESINLIQHGKYKLPRKINPSVFPFIQNIIKKMMQCKANKRYQDLSNVIRKLSKYMRKYQNDHEIQTQIKDYITGEEAKTVPDIKKITKEKKGGVAIIKAIAVFFILILLFSGLTFVFYSLGLHKILFKQKEFSMLRALHYELLNSREFGALTITVKIPKENFTKKIKDVYINAALSQEKTDVKKSNPDSADIRFSEDKSVTNKTYYIMKSRRIYLYEGDYNIRLDAENENFEENITVDTGYIQKNVPKNIEFTLKPEVPIPFKMDYNVYDMVSGRELTQDTNLKVSYERKGTWSNINQLTQGVETLSNIFVSGRPYSFKFEMDGYYKKIYTVRVDPYQSAVNLNINLIPIPGTLSIRANFAGLDILLNNSAYYFTGGESRKYMKIHITTLKKQNLKLSPGEYFLTVKKPYNKGRTEKITIASDKTIDTDINYNEKAKTFEINFSGE